MHTMSAVLDWLPDVAQLNGVGVVGLCVLGLIAVSLEWVVPGRSHRRQLDAKDRENEFLRATVKEYAEVGRTVEAFMESVKKQAERRRGDDT